MLGIDTFSWNKIIRLLQTQWEDPIKEIIKDLDIFITTEGKKEFEHRFQQNLDLLNDISILPVLNTPKYANYVQQYDPTDASLLEYSEIRGYRLITEDRPLLEEGITAKKNIIQLLDLFYELYQRDDFFTQTEMYQLIKLFRQWRNIKEKKAKFYRKNL